MYMYIIFIVDAWLFCDDIDALFILGMQYFLSIYKSKFCVLSVQVSDIVTMLVSHSLVVHVFVPVDALMPSFCEHMTYVFLLLQPYVYS